MDAKAPRLPPLQMDGQLAPYCVSHFGENPASLPANDSVDSLFVTMRVCQACRDSLLHAFDHCLVKEGDVSLESIRQIDEQEEGRARSEQPYFDIVKDPTLDQSYGDESQEQVQRDRWAHEQSKRPVVLERLPKGSVPLNSQSGHVFSKGPLPLHSQSGHIFSGAIYKRMLEAKEREINQLRKKLYESMKMRDSETSNVQRLRVALNRSVTYYTFADEWQQSESVRLQETIRYLKGETSALMAHLIHSEEQKRLVFFP